MSRQHTLLDMITVIIIITIIVENDYDEILICNPVYVNCHTVQVNMYKVNRNNR